MDCRLFKIETTNGLEFYVVSETTESAVKFIKNECLHFDIESKDMSLQCIASREIGESNLKLLFIDRSN